MKFKTYLFKTSRSLPSSNPFLFISDEVLNSPIPALTSGFNVLSPMIYKQHQKLESDVQLMQFALIGIWMASLPLFRNTISWIVLSVHVINNPGAENEEFLKGEIKGRTLNLRLRRACALKWWKLRPCCVSTLGTLLNLIGRAGDTSRPHLT